MDNPSGRSPDAILFDLDNTLCTFIDAKFAACRAVTDFLGTGNMEELFQYFLRPVHSFESPQHITDYMKAKGVFSPVAAEHAIRLFEEEKIAHIRPYPGVHHTLKSLASMGIKMAVVTDAASKQARQRLKKCDIDGFFPVLITPDRSGKRKPDHTPFQMALKELNASGTIWLVGDSIRREVIPGQQLGFLTIYARYGDYFMHSNPECTPDHTIDQFSELLFVTGLIRHIPDHQVPNR
ncbi:HAD hydrolase-like protein [Methanospirillum sp.]|uniref:HAD family hydrolase n=1 Tax=Methanospirillum sp. TaxID=45200 RepID=UPI002CA2C7AD|nr:HAD hydrolase-like protein [Methanospirillum sp.]HOL40800.1 HAD hydrolase-like protein [Methanospirillum sp.]HPP78621.1 HAD hydrolase-like protein [Methanospirillum sp.]